ncbi:hypothetical protein pdam_00025484 [Pocillopora damicornis]|uniref:YqaJ viral recombinase domain-containing protein n=1 Tax=Pocillopora damicornis TaxID=46731 RepID=A0A3M6V4C2_POCDA|nr:hypothetical protein pdam_00025484 [Pocillopora damicornis]
MEKVAKDKYVKLFQREHKDAKFRECGLFIDESDQFIGASPDLLVECSCCGLGVLEKSGSSRLYQPNEYA